MSQYDDRLPEDLRDIAARLSAARHTPSPLELDELRQRVHGRIARARRAPKRRGLASVLRMNFVAVLLTTGLVLTSGVGVVLACTGGPPPPPPGGSSSCQYNKWWTKSGSWTPSKGGSLSVTETWQNSKLTVSITYTPPKGGKDGFTYQFSNGGLVTVTGLSTTVTTTSEPKSLTVVAGGTTYVFTFTY